MRYEHLPRQDKLALEWYIDCLKKIADISIDYEIYESPSLYIIYLDDNIFEVLEDKIDEILDHNHRFLTIDKEILFSPRSFMVSYEEKIEGWLDINYCESLEIKPDSCNSNYLDSNYNIQEIKQDIRNINMPNNSTRTYLPFSNKAIKQERGVANECSKAA